MSRPSTPTSPLSIVVTCLERVASRLPPLSTRTLLVEDLGLDSYMFVDVVLELERALGLALSDERLVDARSVGDLVDAVVHAAEEGR